MNEFFSPSNNMYPLPHLIWIIYWTRSSFFFWFLALCIHPQKSSPVMYVLGLFNVSRIPFPLETIIDGWLQSVSPSHELPNFLINASAPARQEKSLMTASSSFKSRIRRTGMAIHSSYIQSLSQLPNFIISTQKVSTHSTF